MDIPTNPKMFCTDGYNNRSTCILQDPIKGDIIHFVIEESNLPSIGRLVPIENIAESSHDEIRIVRLRNCQE